MDRGDGPALRAQDGAHDTGEAAGLLERAVGYALGAAQSVTPALLGRPTPCAAWDLGRLMAHLDDSLAALHEGITEGAVALGPRTAPDTDRAPALGHVKEHGARPRTPGPIRRPSSGGGRPGCSAPGRRQVPATG